MWPSHVARPFRLNPKPRRRFRLPRTLHATRAGWCFVVIVFGVGFAALNTGNNLLYLILSFMLSFLVLSGVFSESALRGVRIRRRLPRDGRSSGSTGRFRARLQRGLRRRERARRLRLQRSQGVDVA